MLEVDARGFSCPIPVVKTQKAIGQSAGDQITVLVNDDTAKENVSRLARGKGYSVRVEEVSGEYRLTLTPQ